MSLALAKRSLKMFESEENTSKKCKKIKKPIAKQQKPQESADEKVRKILLMNVALDDKLAKNLLRKATKGKTRNFKSTTSKKTDQVTEAIFTEEDFKNFEADYNQIALQGNT